MAAAPGPLGRVSLETLCWRVKESDFGLVLRRLIQGDAERLVYSMQPPVLTSHRSLLSLPDTNMVAPAIKRFLDLDQPRQPEREDAISRDDAHRDLPLNSGVII
jgi:hypothetical protein